MHDALGAKDASCLLSGFIHLAATKLVAVEASGRKVIDVV
jgi:hypothetical protein